MSEKDYKRTYYIIFENVEAPRWWKLFLNKKINHCYAITAIDSNRTLIINQTERGIQINAYGTDVDTLALKIFKKKNIEDVFMVEREVNEDKMRSTKFGVFGNCASLCKDLLGIKKPFIFTPNQLFHYLKREA